MRVVVINHVSLDGVLQSPGRPDEDPRDGFRHGGWAVLDDPELPPAIGGRLGADFSWLFGRFSYEDMLGHWNEAGGPFKDGLNAATKYVVSSDPDLDLPWPNSTLITGDVLGTIASMREQPGGNLVIMGSGHLVRSLLPAGLIDEIFLMINPVVLGSGQRLFGPDEQPRHLALVDSSVTERGVVTVTYRAE